MRKFLLAVILTAFFLTQAACGSGKVETPTDDTGTSTSAPSLRQTDGGGPSPNRPEQQQTGSVTLRLMYGFAPETASDPMSEAVFAKLGLTVEPFPITDISPASEDMPDLMLIDLSSLQTYIDDALIRSIPREMISPHTKLAAITAVDPEDGDENADALWFIPRINDTDPVYNTGPLRILYRKDLANELKRSAPKTTEDLYEMAVAFADAGYGMAVDRSADCFAWMHGIDPGQWIYENDRYLPACYSDACLTPLLYARRLWEAGALSFEMNDNAGIMVTALNSLSDWERAYENGYIVMDIPHAPNSAAVWQIKTPPEGWVARAGLSDEALEKALSLFEYSLTDEARAYARYGLQGITYTKTGGGLFFFTDPETNRAYDLDALYPTQGFLNLITRDMSRETDFNLPSLYPQELRASVADIRTRYYRPAATEKKTDFLSETARAAYNERFIEIITRDEPVADAFARFKATAPR